jgi:tetratricopeptide (TPR) repeat protein
MVSLGQTLENEEGQQLAQLYSITLASNNVRGPSPETVLSNVSNGTPSPYVLQELWMQKARRALSEGDLQTAFDYSQKIVEKMPDSALLRDASLFFQRVLLLQVDNLLRKNENLKLLLLFLKEKKRRFREPAVRGLLHLYVARATRELKMLELAIQDVISEGGLPGANDPKVSALLNLELTGVYRELIQDNESTGEEARTDINQFKQLVESLQKRYPNQFDSYDYWASLGYYHELQGNLRKAKQIYLYALNGPNMNPKERLLLGESIFKVYMAMPDKEKALHALKVLLLIHDEYRDQLNMPGFRAKILWKRVELNIDRQDWPSTVKSIKEYLVESQSVLSRIQSEQLNSKDDERRKELLFYSDLDAERRREALFYHGYALLKIGLVRQAKKQWDLLYKEAPDDVYGTLAEEELRMLSWRESISPELVKDIAPTP